LTTEIPPEAVVLKLTGSAADGGLLLGNLTTFVEEFRRALRDFDRHRRAERTRRGGHPSGREEFVTAFRLVDFSPGSAVMTLLPEVPASEAQDQPALAKAEVLPEENLRALLDAVEDPKVVLDPAVTDALDGARRSLGVNGQIDIRLGDRRRPRRQVVIDERRVAALRERVREPVPRLLRVSGRLHMIDLEPDRVGIRARDGIDWICSYKDELENAVRALVGMNVWARGTGQVISAARGTMRISEIHAIGEYAQTPLFTFERVPVEQLMLEQGIEGPQGKVSIVPDDLSDEEVDLFFDAIIDQ
jgi:hypothetical protein